MRNLLLEDLLLGLNDLLDKRVALLRSSATGRTYEPLLVAQRDAIQALPEAARHGAPLAEQLAEKDARHDAFGAAIYYMTEAYLRLEAYEPDAAARARAVREAFIPALSELRASYPTEAAAATRRTPKLDTMKAELKQFPVMGGTLYKWVKEYVKAGKELEELYSDRSMARAERPSDRGPAGTLRGQTIGLLTRARAMMQDELEANKDLPRDLVERTFGYFDELSLTRASKTSGGKKAKAREDKPANG